MSSARFQPRFDGFSAAVAVSGTTVVPHCHDEIEFGMTLSGSYLSTVGGRAYIERAGDVTLFWAAVPHRAVRIIRPGRFAVVTAPVPWFMGCRFGFRLVERVLAGEMVIEPSSDRRGDAGAFMRWQADLASDDAERRDIAQQEIRARLRRMALHIADARPESAESEQAEFECDATLVMARYIAENFREPITVADVADAARMSPDRAARLFSKVWHMSPTAFVARYRLLEAQRLLATSSYKIIEISERSGFGSVSQFYAAFQKAYGCSPRHCRQTLTGAAPLAETSAGRP